MNKIKIKINSRHNYVDFSIQVLYIVDLIKHFKNTTLKRGGGGGSEKHPCLTE